MENLNVYLSPLKTIKGKKFHPKQILFYDIHFNKKVKRDKLLTTLDAERKK